MAKISLKECKYFADDPETLTKMSIKLNHHFLNGTKKDIILGDVYEYLGFDTTFYDESIWHKGWKWDEEKQEYLDFGWLL